MEAQEESKLLLFSFSSPRQSNILYRSFSLSRSSRLFCFPCVCTWFELGVLLFAGHDKQREGTIREESADSDGAEGLRGAGPQPAGEQLQPRQYLVFHQHGGDGGGVLRAGLPAAQPLRRQEENAYVTSAKHLGGEIRGLKREMFWFSFHHQTPP